MAVHSDQYRPSLNHTPPERPEFAFLGIRWSQVPRAAVLHGLITFFAIALCVRLFCLQYFASQSFVSRALQQQVSEETIPARPGNLFDRHGRLLATTISVPSLFVNPKAIPEEERPQLAMQLGAALHLSSEEILRKLETQATRQFLWIKRRLNDQEAAAIRKLELPSRWAGTRREFQRVYPQGHLAAHLVGLRNIDGQGRGGVEEFFDARLRGEEGVRHFVRDARGYVLDVLEEVTKAPIDGTSLVLTIDVVLQLHLERQLDAVMEKHQAKGACGVAIDPQTGEILAMASRPTFDPNHPELAQSGDWKNMVTSSAFEPGSTFKPMVVAWGLDRNVITRDEVFDCENGAYRMGRRILHDHHPYGELSLTDVLAKSSNIGMAKIGERLGNDQLHELAKAFGFGSKTGIELPGELSGLLRPKKEWTRYSTGSIPMGHELTATPLQILAAYAILANGGKRVSPHLLLKETGPQERVAPVVTSRVIDADPVDWLVTGPLVEVIHRGTGRHARIPEMTVFGKTGTAQKTDGKETGYSTTRHFSSFVGGATAENPRLVVLISVDEPQGTDQYGGSVAAPAVAAVLKEGMRLMPGGETGILKTTNQTNRTNEMR